MLITLFYPQINDFYTYSVPIKHAIDPTPDFFGDIHYEKFPKGTHSYYASIENFTPQSDGSLDIDFGKNDYGWSNGYRPIPEFSYSTNIRINQTFAVICHDFTQPLALETLINPIDTQYPLLEVLKYLGPIQNDEGQTDYKFYHVQRSLQSDVPCNYPQIIEHSIDAVDLAVP